MKIQPTGTVTFLFTDIVASTTLWEADTKQMAVALARHDAILEQTAAVHHGYVFKRVGDGFCIVFQSAVDALLAAIEGQRSLISEKWDLIKPISVRMALHSGVAEEREGDYFGPVVNRVARLQAISHGGQILLSQATWQLLADHYLPNVDWLNLGQYALTGLTRPEQVHQVVVADLPSDFPPVSSVAACPNNLYAMPTPFVGRRKELASLEACLQKGNDRLITIIGPGGMGKTRLALELAGRQCQPRAIDGKSLAYQFPDGVYFVRMAAIESTDEILPALVQSLGFQPQAEDPGGRSSKQQLLDFLQRKKLLLILDNFEQLTTGAGIITDLLEAAPRLFILVTSRERLSLQSEHLFPLTGMRYPDVLKKDNLSGMLEEHSALSLFAQAAQRVDPGFELSNDGALSQAIRICQLLDGLPLAIEMAAGWVDILPLAEIATEIEHDLGFLQTDLVDVTARHRSMETVFEATWRRLSFEDRALFQSLAVFRGGFTRKAAEIVANATLVQLAALMKKSLLHHDRKHDRYHIHRLLRQFGEKKLSDDPVAEVNARKNHAITYCLLLEKWGCALFGARQLEILEQFDQEISNVRSAWVWAVENTAVDQIDQAIEPLCRYYNWRIQRGQIEETCRPAIIALSKLNTPQSKRILAKVLSWQGWELPDVDDLLFVERSLDLLAEAEKAGVDVRAEKSFVLSRLAWLKDRSDYESTLGDLKNALALCESLGDPIRLAGVLQTLTWHAIAWGRYQEARGYNQRWIVLLRELGDRNGLAHALDAMGITATYMGDFEDGFYYLKRSIALCRAVDNKWRQAATLNEMGFLLLNLGRFAEARAAYDEQLGMLREFNVFDAEPVSMLAFSLVGEGRYKLAGSIIEEVDHKRDENLYNRGNLAWAQGTVYLGLGMGEKAVPLLEESVSIFEQRAQVTVLAGVSAFLAMADSSRTNISRALKNAVQAQSFLAYIMTVPAVAAYFLAQGDLERAVELYALASNHRFVADSHWYRDILGRPIADAARELPESVFQSASSRGRQRELSTTISELAGEFGLPSVS